MSSYNYSSPPSSPVASFFPNGPASPNAFTSFHQSPRDAHSMYAALSPSTQANVQRSAQSSGGGTLKKLMRK